MDAGCALLLLGLLFEGVTVLAVSLLFGDTGGVTPAPGLVLTVMLPGPGPGLAYFSGREIPDTGV